MAPYQLGPVESGDYTRSFARRVEELGVGFYPLGVDPEQLAELRKVVRETARARGRNPPPSSSPAPEPRRSRPRRGTITSGWIGG